MNYSKSCGLFVASTFATGSSCGLLKKFSSTVGRARGNVGLCVIYIYRLFLMHNYSAPRWEALFPLPSDGKVMVRNDGQSSSDHDVFCFLYVSFGFMDVKWRDFIIIFIFLDLHKVL